MNYYRTQHYIFASLVSTLISLAMPSTSHADEPPADPLCLSCVEVGAWRFGLNIGLGVRTNPLYKGDDIPLILLPQISYYGERFFLENLDAGFTLFETPRTMLNLLVTPSYDGVFFNRWDPGNVLLDPSAGVGGGGIGDNQEPGIDTSEQSTVEGSSAIEVSKIKSRRFSYMGGFEVSHELPLATLQFSYTREFTGRHSGSEARFAFQKSLSAHLSGTAGFTWKDKILTDYYYGVHQGEAINPNDRYKPHDSLNPFVRLSATIGQSKQNWRVSVEYQKLDKQIVNSPLVEKKHLVSAFIGKQIKF